MPLLFFLDIFRAAALYWSEVSVSDQNPYSLIRSMFPHLHIGTEGNRDLNALNAVLNRAVDLVSEVSDRLDNVWSQEGGE